VTCFPRPRIRPGTGLNRVPSAIGALVGRLVADEARQGAWSLRGQDSVNFRCRSSLPCALDDNERRALNRVGVVALLECVGGQIRADGLVTMDRSRGFDAVWSDLRLRRLGLHIVGTIARGTRWSAFDRDGEQTEKEVRIQVTAFMRDLCDAGAFPGQDPDACWYIAMDSRSPAEAAPTAFTFTVGFAPNAGEFVAFRFEQDQLDCRVHPVGWQPRVALAS
jgi:phage tail sheath protein FI